MYVYVCVGIYICALVHLCIPSMLVVIYTCMWCIFLSVGVCTFMCVNVRMCVCTCLYVHVCMCVHMCVYDNNSFAGYCLLQ